MAVWPPSGPPMAHGLPGSSGPACSVLPGPFRWLRPMGWIEQTVQRVEAERRDAIQLADHAAEAAVRAGEQLVPGDSAASRSTPTRRRARRAGVWSVGHHALACARPAPGRAPRRGAPAERRPYAQSGDRLAQAQPGGFAHLVHQRLEQPGTDLELDAEVLSGGGPLDEVAPPTGEPVGPGHDLHLVRTDLGGDP